MPRRLEPVHHLLTVHLILAQPREMKPIFAIFIPPVLRPQTPPAAQAPANILPGKAPA